jgi:hypothetical protein
MLGRMRTSFDLPDPLLDDAKRLAIERGVPLRDLVEEGLRLVLAAQGKRAKPYKLENFTYGTGGLVEGLEWGDWDRMQELSYGDRY